jgi:hypothetical protein
VANKEAGRTVLKHRDPALNFGNGRKSPMSASDVTRQSVDPRTVLSPLRSVSDLWVIYDGGLYVEGDPWSGWSVARLKYDGIPAAGVRWNGVAGEHPGTPSGHGFSTWYILPDPLAEVVIDVVNDYLAGKDEYPTRLRRRVNELLAAARAAKPDELARLQLYLSP